MVEAYIIMATDIISCGECGESFDRLVRKLKFPDFIDMRLCDTCTDSVLERYSRGVSFSADGNGKGLYRG